MLFRSISIITVLIGLVFVVFVQSEQANPILSHRSEAKFPLITDEEASQWLSTRGAPHRWRNHHINQPSNEIQETLQELDSLNNNGIHQSDTKSFEGVSMEVIFEMVNKQHPHPHPHPVVAG